MVVKKKKTKEKKVFKVGDILKCIKLEQGKLPKDCYEFLLTYKKFKVLEINDKLNIDIGYRLAENGNVYYFSPNRFDLYDNNSTTSNVFDDEDFDDYDGDDPDDIWK